jgi:hypothetical protein
MDTPRLRMFAGPNASGKCTIKGVVPPELLGVYLNPDEIEKEIRDRDFLDLRAYGVETTRAEILPFFANSTLLLNAGLDDEAECLRFSDGNATAGSLSIAMAKGHGVDHAFRLRVHRMRNTHPQTHVGGRAHGRARGRRKPQRNPVERLLWSDEAARYRNSDLDSKQPGRVVGICFKGMKTRHEI